MYATFTTTASANAAVWWFARFYLYIFVTLFIYVVLSLFISIIMDAYEVIKERYDLGEEKTDLQRLIALCVDTPSSGKFNRQIPRGPGAWQRMIRWVNQARRRRRDSPLSVPIAGNHNLRSYQAIDGFIKL